MRKSTSQTVFWSNVVFFVTALAITLFWLPIIQDRDGWGKLFFLAFVAPIFCTVDLFFGVAFGALLFFRSHHTRDRNSLLLSTSAFGIVAVEAVVLSVTPMPGC
ncbi:hypothetical protein ACXR0O_00880 [Verrucomicrobiota bacterium sgz303538]